MWRKSKQVERTACDRLPADSGTVLQYRDELSEIGPVLTNLAGRGDGVVMPSVQHFALQQQLASLTATVGDHETAILELQRQVASLAPDVQSLDTKVRELGVLLSESLSVVEGFVAVMDEDLKNGLEAMEKKVMPQRMVQLERLSGQVDRLSAQTGAALLASKNLTAGGKKSDGAGGPLHCCLSSGGVLTKYQRPFRLVRKNLEQWGVDVTYRYIRPFEDRVAYLEQCCL